jgi:flagellar biosynthetic protein FliR
MDVPPFVRVVLTVSLAGVIFPIALPTIPPDLSLGQTAAGLVGEIAIGELLGLSAGAVLHAAALAGHVVAQQSGLALGSVFNPLFESETSPLEQLGFFAAALTFFAVRGHVELIRGLLSSFQTVPPLMFAADADAADFAAAILTSICELAMRLAGPALLTLLLSTVAMGFVGRTMPQLNILSVGFSLKLMLVLAVTALVTTAMDEPLVAAIRDGLDEFGRLMSETGRKIAAAASSP